MRGVACVVLLQFLRVSPRSIFIFTRFLGCYLLNGIARSSPPTSRAVQSAVYRLEDVPMNVAVVRVDSGAHSTRAGCEPLQKPSKISV